MKNTLLTVQIIISCLLVGAILLQAKGTGLGSTLIRGELYTTKRGLEKAVFVGTIVLAALFAIIALMLLVI